jgi:streptogramin lyase
MSRLRLLTFTAVFIGIVVFRPALAASAESPLVGKMLMGTIRGTDGQALEGVTVSAKEVDGTITVSVYTLEQGNYYFPVLPGGKYKVWAQAVGYEAGRAEVSLASNREAHQDFTLKTMKDFTQQLSSPEWLSALPDGTAEDRRLKQLLVNTCTDCHAAAKVLEHRFDEAGWRAIITLMEGFGPPSESGPRRPDPIINHYKEELVAYLAKMRGPGPSPMKIKPYPRPTGDAARVVITEYDVPTAESPNEFLDQSGSDWSEGISSGGNVGSTLHDVAIDRNGNVWSSEVRGNRNRSFVKLDVGSGKTTNFRLPSASRLGYARATHGVAVDQSGIIWYGIFADAGPTGLGSFARVDPKTDKVDVLDPPEGSVGPSVQVDAHGNIWGTQQEPGVAHNKTGGAVVYDPATQKFTYFKPVTPGTGGYGAAGDADGNGWFSNPGVDIVGFANYETGKVGEIRLSPRPGMAEISTPEDRKFYEQVESSYVVGLLPAQGPRRMAAQGDYVWWSNWYGQSIGRANIHTHEVNYYVPPLPNLSPYDPAVDKNGKVWVSLPNDDRVAKFDPVTGHWTVYNLPSRGTNTRYITTDRFKDPVEVWTSGSGNSKIVHLQFRTKEQLQTLTSSNTTAKNTGESQR